MFQAAPWSLYGVVKYTGELMRSAPSPVFQPLTTAGVIVTGADWF